MPFASTSHKERGSRGPLRVATAVLSLLLSLVLHARGQPETPAAIGRGAPRTYRAGTELVALQVSVVDPQRRYVSGLSAEDFAVFEDGAPQAVTLFATATSPLDVMLLLDTSSSMTGRIALAQHAAIGFMRALRPEDRAAVVLFDHQVHVAQPLTSNRAALESAVWSARPDGSTAFYQAVYIALRELAGTRRGGEPLRRQALIVLTDGDDTASSLSYEDVLDEARRTTVTIFTIMPTAPFARPSTLSSKQVDRRLPFVPFPMRTLAEETGGRAVLTAERTDLSGTYREIADELSHQYWLAYTPAQSSAGFKRISVRLVGRPGVRARTRSGYYAAQRPLSGRAISGNRDHQ